MPNVSAVNALGDFAIGADRLAIIDGEGKSSAEAANDHTERPIIYKVDPWRPCTPHSSYAPDRGDTMLRPFKLIPGTVFDDPN